MEKRLERFRFQKRPQNRDLRFARSVSLSRARFEPVPDPIPDARILNVLELGADGVGVDGFQKRDHVAQRHFAAVEKELRGDDEIEVFFAKPELAQSQKRIGRAFVRKRIDPRDRVAKRAIGVNQTVDAGLQRLFADLSRRRHCRRAVAQFQVAQLEPFEKREPARVERLGILLPALIIFLEQIEIGPSGEQRVHERFNLRGIAEAGKLTVPRALRYLLTPAMTTTQIFPIAAIIALLNAIPLYAQADPASEPAVLAVAKVLPAVVNINTERVVRRRVRDPFEDFASQFFGNYRSQPREIRQTLQSLGSGFIVDPAGYIVTNEHVVQRAADLKIEVTMNDGKVYNARYITGDEKKDLAFIKIEAKADFPFIDLNNISPNLLGQTVLVVGNALGYGSSISRGVLSGTKRDITVEDVDYKNLVQTDAAINPGNSGGAGVDLSGSAGELRAAPEAFTPQGVPTQGLGFAISAEVVRDSVNRF